MGKVYINGREAVHKGCGGRAIAFPDVCLCPPGPPAGPVPVPLTNTVQAKDLVNGTITVLFEGNPAGHRDSYFDSSTGNEVSRSTGGGIVSHAVQGKAYFASWSPNVFIAGKPAVRHGDLLTQNHLGKLPANTPPSVWMSSVSPDSPMPIPKKYTKILQEGRDWIEIVLVDDADEPIAYTPFRLTTPKAALVEARFLWGGHVIVQNLCPGRCELVLPQVDELTDPNFRVDAAQAPADTTRYRPGQPLPLRTGKVHRVFAAQMKTLFVELPLATVATKSEAHRFTLSSNDGAYRVARTVADDLVKDDGILTFAFPGVFKGPQYTLVHDDGAGGVHEVFAKLTFGDLFPKEACFPDEEPGARADLRIGAGRRRAGGKASR
jgi:hypothetical protein